MYMTRTRPIIYSTGRYTKYYAVYFEKKASWVKPAATNFGVGLMPEHLQGGGGYEQILTLGLVYWYKQGIVGIDVFLLSSYEV